LHLVARPLDGVCGLRRIQVCPQSGEKPSPDPGDLPSLRTSKRSRPRASISAIAPEAVADIIVYLASDTATLVSGAVVPAYSA